jgi:malonate transporter
MISQVIPLFFVIFFGAFAYRIGFKDSQFSKNLNTFVFYFALPCFIFHELANIAHGTSFPWLYFIAFGLSSFFTMSLAYFALPKVENKKELWLRTFSSVHSNAGYLGIPFSLAVFNTSLPAIVVILFQVLIFTPAQILILSYYKNSRENFLFVLAKNPILFAAILGALMAAFGVPTPRIVDDSLSFVGRSAMPLALFSLGLFMGEQISTVFEIRKTVLALMLFKNVIHPVVAYIIGRYLFVVDANLLPSLVVMASMPTAINNFIFSREYQAFEKDSGAVIVYTTLMFMFLSFIFAWAFKI